MEKTENKLKEELLAKLTAPLNSQKRDSKSIELITKAFDLAYEKHSSQKRKSGEPYIIHPTAVAEILIGLQCDAETICAGLLHDTLEDTETTREDLEKEFGKEILELVEGVTKLGKLNFSSQEEAQANNFRKMLLAIASDMRVVLVKLADRLHNMRTLEHLSEEKKQRIAKETLDIFAPLSNRFGLGAIKSELEDLAFKNLDPDGYKQVEAFVATKEDERLRIINSVIHNIKTMLESNNINAEIIGRAKHYYSIHHKIKRQGKQEIYDLRGIRIITENVKECYEVLGFVHDAFRPLPGRFKDYIAMPKSNLYRSLHTTIIGPDGKPIEVQIRTKEMHSVAENGIAAHWHYKEKGSNKAAEHEIEQLTWLRQLIGWHTDLTDAEEYLDSVKVDIFSQELYILSPAGDVYTLPFDSTPVDFAYRVHSHVGDKCTGAKVNGKIVSLDYKLQNGDLVEIITSKASHPNLNWLNFVKTNQAKHRIKSWYKKQNRDQHIATGRSLLEEEFTKEGLERLVRSKELEKAAEKLNSHTIEDLYASIGSGDNSVAQVKGRLDQGKPKERPQTNIQARKAPSKGTEADIPDLDGLLYHIAKCCMPVPGEEIVGAVSKGRGISIHKADCINIKQIEDERIMDIKWETKETKVYPANLIVEVFDRVGVVRDLLTFIADANINIRDFKVTDRPTENTATIRMLVEVTGLTQLKHLSNKIMSSSDVVKVERA